MISRRTGFNLLAAALLAAWHPASAAPEAGGIGLEQEVSVTLDRGDYQPKPMDDRTPLILRLEKVSPAADGKFTYVFRYIGFEPGSYKLADYLIRPDGTPATDLTEVPIKLGSILPPDHKGELSRFSARPFPWVGGYRMLLWGLGALWLCGLPALIWLGRKKTVVTAAPPPPPVPSFAERMRPLVHAAAAGNLDASGHAELERLMTGYWREKAARPDQRMSEAFTTLKAHAEAGPLMRALERWLHTPQGASRAEVEALLAPYQETTAAGNEVPA